MEKQCDHSESEVRQQPREIEYPMCKVEVFRKEETRYQIDSVDKVTESCLKVPIGIIINSTAMSSVFNKGLKSGFYRQNWRQ